MTNKIPENNDIEEILKTVYDPEFPIVDIYTLGLIYDITVNIEEHKIFILMTLTSPACPLGDMICDNIKESIKKEYPEFETLTEITFEPMWSPDSIKDDDLKRMFNV